MTRVWVGVLDLDVRRLRGVVESELGVMGAVLLLCEATDTEWVGDCTETGIDDTEGAEYLETEELGITVVTSEVVVAIVADCVLTAAVRTADSAIDVCALKERPEKFGVCLLSVGAPGETVNFKLILSLSIATGASISIITEYVNSRSPGNPSIPNNSISVTTRESSVIGGNRTSISRIPQ